MVGIYAEAGLPLPRLDNLTPEWVDEAQEPSKAHLAIDALKAELLEKSAAVTQGNGVRRRLGTRRGRAMTELKALDELYVYALAEDSGTTLAELLEFARRAPNLGAYNAALVRIQR